MLKNNIDFKTNGLLVQSIAVNGRNSVSTQFRFFNIQPNSSPYQTSDGGGNTMGRRVNDLSRH